MENSSRASRGLLLRSLVLQGLAPIDVDPAVSAAGPDGGFYRHCHLTASQVFASVPTEPAGLDTSVDFHGILLRIRRTCVHLRCRISHLFTRTPCRMISPPALT